MLTRRSILRAGLSLPLLGAAAAGSEPCSFQDVLALDRWMAGLKLQNGSDPVAFAKDADTRAFRPLWSELLQDSTAASTYAQTLAKAYAQMKDLSAKDATDPRGLSFQAWLHWIQCPRAGDYSRTSIHASAGFLPWHRAYLYYYERLIQTLANAPDFRLAAWDWENIGTVPAAYGDDSLLTAFPSSCGYDRGKVDVTQTAAVTTGWLQSTQSMIFMGTRNHGGNAMNGPHSAVHLNSGGLMTELSVAAFDPLFFAHHTNIDRFWDYWYQRYKNDAGFFTAQTYPSSAPWTFYDAKTNRYVSVSPDDVLTLDSVGYQYKPPSNVPLYGFATVPGEAGSDGLVRFSREQAGRLVEGCRQRTSSFSLPLLVRMKVPAETNPGSYTVALRVRRLGMIPLGKFSYAGGHHGAGEVTAFGCIERGPLEKLLSGAESGFTVEMDPRIRSWEMGSLDLRHPKSAADWDLLG